MFCYTVSFISNKIKEEEEEQEEGEEEDGEDAVFEDDFKMKYRHSLVYVSMCYTGQQNSLGSCYSFLVSSYMVLLNEEI